MPKPIVALIIAASCCANFAFADTPLPSNFPIKAKQTWVLSFENIASVGPKLLRLGPAIQFESKRYRVALLARNQNAYEATIKAAEALYSTTPRASKGFVYTLSISLEIQSNKGKNDRLICELAAKQSGLWSGRARLEKYVGNSYIAQESSEGTCQLKPQ